MTQLDLLGQFEATVKKLAAWPPPYRVDRPAARRTDPEGSHEAAREVTASGERAAQARFTLLLLRKHPGATSAELADAHCHGDRHTESSIYQRWRYIFGRRLPELGTAGLVYAHALSNPGRRPYIVVVQELEPCTVSGKRVMRWWPAREPGED